MALLTPHFRFFEGSQSPHTILHTPRKAAAKRSFHAVTFMGPRNVTFLLVTLSIAIGSLLAICVSRGCAPSGVFVHGTALHHKHHAPDSGDVFQRISMQRDDVRLHAGRD